MFRPWRIVLTLRKGKELLAGWGDEFSALWNLARNLFFAIGILLFFFVVVEITKFYQFLSTLNRPLAIVLTILILAGLSWFPVKFTVAFLRTPSSITPPKTRLSKDLALNDLHCHRKFLVRFLARLAGNPMLSDEERTTARSGLSETRRLKKTQSDDLFAGLLRVRQTFVIPLVEILDGKAKEEVKRAALHITGGVMLSPYQSVDALITIGRTTGMAVKVIRIYYSRPTIKETVLILIDVARIAAYVNILNVGGMVFRSLSSTPIVGWVASAATQGFGAGLLVLVVGETTRKRCQTLEKWDVNDARLGIQEKMGVYSEQARTMVSKGMTRLREKAPEVVKKGWDATQKTVSASLGFVAQSASSAVSAARDTAPKVTEFSTQAVKTVTDSTIKSAKKTAELLGRKWYRRKKYVPPDRIE
ncbi:MAG: DUF697 domain-containing protein [Acidobacteria bacterium]|nr:DUF697 domain-containing protein [Acidobacteriota bacterium]